jgi:hypothetical protein
MGGMTTQPSLFIPHGGGPCFFMPDPRGTWTRMGDYLRSLPATLPGPPRAILVVSGHWEEPAFTFTGAERHPGLIFDYYGFPEHTYKLEYPAPGSPALAARVRDLLADAGIASQEDATRGFDHGVFVPFLLMYPDADIPVVQLSLRAVDAEVLVSRTPPPREPALTTACALAQVCAARERQQRRQGACNARLAPGETLLHCRADAPGMQLLRRAANEQGHSARGQHRILRVARTIADLAGRDEVNAGDVAEALAMRWEQ